MFTREQQLLIDLTPESGVQAINGRPVRRDVSGDWFVGRNMVCDGVKRCSTLPEALAAVQPEKPLCVAPVVHAARCSSKAALLYFAARGWQ
jgi:hypothetical protein